MANTPVAYLTRRDQFSASHRLYSKDLSAADNLKIYSKCTNPNGHGHNYYIEVTVRGPVNAVSGMVMNMDALKGAINQGIIEVLDHKCIDKDVEYFKSVVSTTENVAVFAWTQLQKTLPDPTLLYEVKIWETEKNIVAYRGETAEGRVDHKPVFLSQ